MRAVAAYPSERRIELVDIPEPAISTATQLKLRMLEVGICGTDREIASFNYGDPPPGSPFLVMGHESLGEVVEVGQAVTRLRPGDLVVLMVRRPCFHPECPACRMGRQDFCVTGNFTERGIQGAHGFLAEYVVEEERWAQPVPHDLAAVAVLTEPLSIAEKALIEVANLRLRLPWASGSVPAVKAPEPCAVVLGAGPAGLLGALALRARGLRTVVYARGPAREGKAAWVPSIGAEYFSSRDLSFADLLARIGRVDLVYEATGAAPAAFEALSSLGANAVFVFTGVPGRRAPLQIQGDAIMRNLVLRNQVVFGTVSAGPDAFAEAVRDLSRFMRMWPKAVRALITRYPMEEALRLVSGEAAGIKKVVAVSGLGS